MTPRRRHRDGRGGRGRSGRDRADRASRRCAASWITASSSTARARSAHEAKLKQKQIQVKEVKFRPGTDEGDYKIKLRNLIRFLEEGDKAKVTLRFRGREMAHQEFGMRLLERVRNDLEPYGVVEQFPKMEGRQMVMVLAPKKTEEAGRKKDAKQRRSKREEAASGPAKTARPSSLADGTPRSGAVKTSSAGS